MMRGNDSIPESDENSTSNLSGFESYLLHAIRNKTDLGHRDKAELVANLLDYNRAKKGGGFLTPLSSYLDILGKTDKVMFAYMNQEQQDKIKQQLQITCLLLLAQQRYELEHQKNEKNYESQIKRCNELLDALNPEFQNAPTQQAQAYLVDGNPSTYLGIPLAKEFAEKLMAFADRKTKSIKEFLGSLNEKRLYWVWGSVFLKTILGSIPEIFNTKRAGEAIKAPDPYTGTLSWGLYYFRFFLNLFLLLKHTIKGPWMEGLQEADIPWYERFQTQWSERKFALLNDSLWGTSNLLSFFWLTGKTLGAWGDAVTIVLLVFDVSVALWDFAEQQTQYNQQMLQYENDIIELTRKKGQRDWLGNDDRKKKELQIQMQIEVLERAREKCRREWQLKKLVLYTNIAYAIALTFSFVMLTMPFIAIPAATALSLGIAGAVLCFAFTVIASAIRGGIEIHKARHALKDIKQEFQGQVKLLKKMLESESHDNATNFGNQEKLLYLEIKKLSAEAEYDRQIIVLQSVHLIRSIIIEAFIPAAIFASLVFLPLGIGIAALAIGAILAVVSSKIINALFKPDESMKELPPFNEEEYEEFCGLVKELPPFEEKEDRSKELFTFFNTKKADKAFAEKENHLESMPLLDYGKDKKTV